jgi:hypothetical protein
MGKFAHASHNWAQKATERMKEKGTEGSLTRIAQSHGESPMEFAREHVHSKGKVGAKSRFAVNINK